MIENIIVYFILFIFSLIGLGVSWENRHDAIIDKTIFLIVPLLLAIYLYLINSSFLLILDMRHLFDFYGEMRARRFGSAIIMFMCGLIIYMVVFLHVLIHLKTCIANARKHEN